ncbi:Ergothioneine biosynthesis protein 1 [Sphaceloma murrayae]|uniref:Ergothioneine biosynthesis protein 1 n=1 Tax=Sphaceloma murrayae TaxID=2082308 RepID=A0A2K1QTS6_9PEZI|nr:Ergothioneine biosynthesis protein 1 [Sphaceloma murrayae]
MSPALLEPHLLESTPPLSAQILDIRNGADFVPLVDQIRAGLKVHNGHEKSLPTLLLYDKAGLQLFERITYLDEYYLTNQEIQILERCADQIARRVALRPDSIFLELGSGNLRKVRLLLDALERKATPVTYYALDLSREELERTLAEIPLDTYQHVKCFGLWGTYDDGLAWLKQPKNLKRPKTILSLGSSIGNFDRKEAAAFLAQFKDVLGPTDSFLLGIDACTDPEKVYHAYNDRHGLTHEFVLNGLSQANKLLGYAAFTISDWEVIGEYDTVAGRHHAFVSPKKDVEVEGVQIRAGERIRIEESYKYSIDQSDELFQAAGMSGASRWTSDDGDYALHLINRPPVQSATLPEQYASHHVPTLEDFRSMWKAWDTVTQDMIPDEELLEKPIKLRNACIFYLGHIPTFLDIHLMRATSGNATDPQYYHQIFERGIDPDVDDPEKCHAHSEIPDQWPPVNEMLEYQSRVRKRVLDLFASDSAMQDRKVQRALWLGLEHEMMHLETLLYMLVQSEKTLPPPGTIQPDFEAIARQAERATVANEWLEVPAQEISIGLDDPDDNSGPEHYMGWDNERPRRSVRVARFQIKGRPITNREYAAFLEQTGKTGTPASWTTFDDRANGHVNGNTNGYANGIGSANGHSNGSNDANGHSNGHSNGHENGFANGHTLSNGDARGACSPSKTFLADKAVRTVYGAVSLQYALDWPVSASYDELTACAAYMGGRIPTFEEARSAYHYAEVSRQKEAQQSLSPTIPAVNSHLINNGVQESPPDGPNAPNSARESPALNPRSLFIDLTHTNTSFKHWHPMPVSHLGNRLAGQSDMGGLWEWTSTTLRPWDGFEAMHLYPGYTADFFDEKHNIVLGGSWATLPRIAGRKSL